MSFKTVTQLRKSGQLEKAKQLATQLLAADSQNIWNRRAMAWVLIDQIKAIDFYMKFEVWNKPFKHLVRQLKNLVLPPSEEILFTQIGWQFVRYFNALAKNSVNVNTLRQGIELLKSVPYSKPSKLHSTILKSLLSFKQGIVDKNFMEWWEWDNLRKEDFEITTFGGKNILSLAEQIFIAYCKYLLEDKSVFVAQYLIKPTHEDIQNFLPFLEKNIKEYPQLQLLPYYQVKLMLSIGEKNKLFEILLPFVSQRQEDYWVWEMFAKAFDKDEIKRVACWCKALTCITAEQFLTKIRQKLAAFFIETKQFKEAKTEIAQIVKISQQHQRKINEKLLQWMQSDWYKNTPLLANNNKIYAIYNHHIDELLYEDTSLFVGVINKLNSQKKIAGFIVNEQIFGQFPFHKLPVCPKVGQLISLRLEEKTAQNGKWYNVLSAKTVDNNIKGKDILISFQAQLTKKETQNHGLAKDIFIPYNLIKKYSLNNGHIIKGKAVKVWDKKTNQWKYIAYKLDM